MINQDKDSLVEKAFPEEEDTLEVEEDPQVEDGVHHQFPHHR